MSIRILTDSAADLLPEDLGPGKLELLPLTIQIGQRSYVANEKFNREDFFRLLASTEIFPTTSQPTPWEIEELFQDARDRGDTLIYVALSSRMSGTYQSAWAIKGMGEYDNVYLLDSQAASTAQRVIALEALRLRDSGLDAPAIIEELERFKKRVHLYAGQETLEYLRRGGRLGNTAAALGTLARIKPLITFTDGGVQVVAKCIGLARAMHELAKIVNSADLDPNYPPLAIYAGSPDNMNTMLSKLSSITVPEEHKSCIGPIVGAHNGPGSYGICIVTKE